MNRWGNPKRTAADRERDLVLFLAHARPEKIREATGQDLAGRYGVSVKVAEYRLALAQQKLAG